MGTKDLGRLIGLVNDATSNLGHVDMRCELPAQQMSCHRWILLDTDHVTCDKADIPPAWNEHTR